MAQFVKNFAAYRLDEILGDWKPYDEWIHNSVERTCKKNGVAFGPRMRWRSTTGCPPGPASGCTRGAGQGGEGDPARHPLQCHGCADPFQRRQARRAFPRGLYGAAGQAYKPRFQAFEYMFDMLGCGPEDVLHCSSSFRYDLMSAYDLGIKNKVWVNRGHEPANPIMNIPRSRISAACPASWASEKRRPVMRFTSYWADTAPAFTGGTPGSVEGAYDVAIVGGGFTGLEAARTLAKAGARGWCWRAGASAPAPRAATGGQPEQRACPFLSRGEIAPRSGAGGHALPGLRRRGGSHRADRRRRADPVQFQARGQAEAGLEARSLRGLARNFEALHREVDPDTAMLDRSAIADEVAVAGVPRRHAIAQERGDAHGALRGRSCGCRRAPRGDHLRECGGDGAPSGGRSPCARNHAGAGLGAGGSGGHRRLHVRPLLVVPPADRGRRQLHRCHAPAQQSGDRLRHRARAHLRDLAEHRQLFPSVARRPPDLRRPRPLFPRSRISAPMPGAARS